MEREDALHDTEKEYWRDRLVSFYETFNPEKLCEVSRILQDYSDREPLLFRILEKKYITSDNSHTATKAPKSK